MKLTLIGHDRRFAAEQAVLNYFPKKDGGQAILRLSKSGRMASAVIEYQNKKAYGRAWVGVANRGFPGQAVKTGEFGFRLIDNALRLAFYRSARQLINPPPWGALTGIRPSKKAIELLDSMSGGNYRLKKTLYPLSAAAHQLQRQYDVSPIRAKMAASCAASAVKLREKRKQGDIALYIGIPFCPTRCAYCSFVSQSTERDRGLLERYLPVLEDEIKQAGETAYKMGLKICEIYWGGGTPAVLTPNTFSRMHSLIAKCFNLEFLNEHTVEAGRPDVICEEKLAAYHANGVSRISVNPQTLNQTVLDKIGRGHTAEQFFAAFEKARKAGDYSINVDLIAGLPCESAESFITGLDKILALAPENITIHTLAKKRSSHITAAQAEVCSAETVGDMLNQANSRLWETGYLPYYLYRQKFTEGGFENTGWSRPGRECAYNLCMMEELSTVLSLGAGGVSKVVTGGRIERIAHCKYPLEYIERRDTIGDKLAAFEAAFKRRGED
jgi:oxygen-independent coproporphyrinogen-3 oxidase